MCLLALMTGLRGRDERVITVLEQTDGKSLRETFGCCVEISEHCVTPPSPHQEDSTGSKFAMIRAMALPARSEHTLISASGKPIYWPIAQTMERIEAVILLL